MSNINTSQTVYLYTTLSGGIQPYDQCARWAGGWTGNNGYTGTLKVGPNLPPTPNVPYIDSANTPCAIPGTDGGSLTGTLKPNGFTGNIGIWVEAADAEGIYAESNHKSYTVLPVSALLVNAGPDQTASGAGPRVLNFSGSSVSGGILPYTYAWSQSFPGTNPDISYFTTSTDLHPNVEEFNADGTYTFTLNVTDSTPGTPLTGSDSLTVTITGATPPLLPFLYSFSTIGSGGSLTIKKNGTTIIHKTSSYAGSYSALLPGDIISITVFKAKINYQEQLADISVEITPPGAPSYFDGDSDTGSGPASATYTFTYQAGYAYDIQTEASSSLI